MQGLWPASNETQQNQERSDAPQYNDVQAREEAAPRMPIPDMIREVLHGGFAAWPNALEKLQQVIGEPINYG